jgi:catechol 2,3-dioxygenase-like lactoylglutathione lyase family enzyme
MTLPPSRGVLQAVDSVQLPVPDLDAALEFYRDRLGHELLWRTDTAAAVRLPRAQTELVLQIDRPGPEVDFLVESVEQAVSDVVDAGGSAQIAPLDIPVGRVARVLDPFGNALTLIDLSKGRYAAGPDGALEVVADHADRGGERDAGGEAAAGTGHPHDLRAPR